MLSRRARKRSQPKRKPRVPVQTFKGIRSFSRRTKFRASVLTRRLRRRALRPLNSKLREATSQPPQRKWQKHAPHKPQRQRTHGALRRKLAEHRLASTKHWAG